MPIANNYLYKISPENDHVRDGRFLAKILAKSEKSNKCTLKTTICDLLYKISPENDHGRWWSLVARLVAWPPSPTY